MVFGYFYFFLSLWILLNSVRDVGSVCSWVAWVAWMSGFVGGVSHAFDFQFLPYCHLCSFSHILLVCFVRSTKIFSYLLSNTFVFLHWCHFWNSPHLLYLVFYVLLSIPTKIFNFERFSSIFIFFLSLWSLLSSVRGVGSVGSWLAWVALMRGFVGGVG